jgi:hypothetical protein
MPGIRVPPVRVPAALLLDIRISFVLLLFLEKFLQRQISQQILPFFPEVIKKFRYPGSGTPLRLLFFNLRGSPHRLWAKLRSSVVSQNSGEKKQTPGRSHFVKTPGATLAPCSSIS